MNRTITEVVMDKSINRLPIVFLILFGICMMYSNLAYAEETQRNVETENLFSEAKFLYLELMQFKDNKKFHEVGFDSCCPFSKWLVKAEALRDHPNGMDLIFEGIFPGDLEKLGRVYFQTHGKDTEYSKKETRKFRQVFNLLKDGEYKPNSEEAISGAKNFEKLVLTTSPQLNDLISFFDVSYNDGRLIVYIKKLFLNLGPENQGKVYSAIRELWRSTNLVKEKGYSANVEVRHQDSLTGSTKSIDLH